MQLPDSAMPYLTPQTDIITLLNNYTQLIERTLKTSDAVISVELRTLLTSLQSASSKNVDSTVLTEILRKLDALEFNQNKIKKNVKKMQGPQVSSIPIQPQVLQPSTVDTQALADAVTRNVVQTLEISFRNSITDTLNTALPVLLQPLTLQLSRIENELTALKLHTQNQTTQQYYYPPQHEQLHQQGFQPQHPQDIPSPPESTVVAEPVEAERKAPSKKVQNKLSKMMDI